eukprot:gene3458-3954_t
MEYQVVEKKCLTAEEYIVEYFILNSNARNACISQNIPTFNIYGIINMMFKSRRLQHRKPRTIFTKEQINSLEKRFSKKQYIGKKERRLMSKNMSLDEMKIKVWFQNRRAKVKRSKAKEN